MYDKKTHGHKRLIKIHSYILARYLFLVNCKFWLKNCKIRFRDA